MRRFWAHITLMIAAIIVMSVSFFTIFTSVSPNMEYVEGNEITYRITAKDDESYEFEDNTAVKDIANQMKDRLNTVGITSYNVKTVGNDAIKVQFAEPNDLNKQNIISYLGFNGSLALSNMDDNENYLHITGPEFLKSDSKTYLDSINGYPTIVIPVDKDSSAFQDLISRTQSQKEAGVGETTETGSTNENGEAETTTTTYLYLWYDFNEETDRYSRTQSSSDDYDVNIARKIIMKFDIDNLYYPDNKNDKLAASLNMDTDSSNSITTTEVRNAYNNARFYVNLLNCSELDYKVTQINDQKVKFVSATTESLIQNNDPHQYVAMSRTLIATICAMVIIGLLLAVFFKLSALSIFTSSFTSLFAAIGFILIMNAEFNIGAIIGLVSVVVASLASGILYASKLKDESYKGRTLKKANTEAGKKSLLPTLDIHIALVFIGVFAYVFGGTAMRTFGLISVVGGLLSLIINLVALRGLMWLLTNNTKFVGKYDLFGIEADKVPAINEEKAKQDIYKGPYAEKDFTKRRKPIGIATLVVFVASLAGLITFGILGNNNPYAQASEAPISQVYVYTQNELSTFESLKADLLDQVIIYSSADDTTGKTLSTYVKNQDSYAHSETVDGVTKTTYYFEYTLNANLNEETEALSGFMPGAIREDLKTALANYNGIDDRANVSVKVQELSSKNQIDLSGIIIGASVAIGVVGVYLLIRYRLSRGLTAIVAPVLTTAIGSGLFVLTRIAFPTTTCVIIPFITFFTFILAIYIMNKDREVYLEDKSNDTSIEHRNEIANKANSIIFEAILILTVVVCYLGINFFGFGPNATSLIFIVLTISSILTAVIMVNQFIPFASTLYKKLAKLENGRRNKPRKKKNGKIISATHRSNEPEEAIFIGIND